MVNPARLRISKQKKYVKTLKYFAFKISRGLAEPFNLFQRLEIKFFTEV